MPNLVFKNVDEDVVANFSKKISKKLSEVVGCPEDWFTYECTSSNFYYGGEQSYTNVIIEVKWYDRPQDVKEQTAQLIMSEIKAVYPDRDVTLFFTTLDKTSFFEM